MTVLCRHAGRSPMSGHGLGQRDPLAMRADLDSDRIELVV